MICTILVNWNGDQDTIECLESIVANETNCDVIVCDNASSPDSVDKIVRWADDNMRQTSFIQTIGARVASARCWDRKEIEGSFSLRRLTLLALKENYGFAAANNEGVALASSSDYEYIFLLNNDTTLKSDAMGAMKARMDANPAMGVCGATLVYFDDRETCQGLGGTFNVPTGRTGAVWRDGPANNLPSIPEVEPRIDYVIGAAMFFRQDVIVDLNGLSEDYFLYFEELDVARRMLPRHTMGWARDAFVYHKVGKSIGTSARSRSSDLSIYFGQRSKLVFYLKYHRRYIPLTLIRTLVTVLAYARRLDTKAVKAVLLGAIDAFSGRLRSPSNFYH